MVLAAVLASQAAKSVDDVDDCGSWSVATTSIIVTCSSEGLQCMYSMLTLCLVLLICTL